MITPYVATYTQRGRMHARTFRTKRALDKWAAGYHRRHPDRMVRLWRHGGAVGLSDAAPQPIVPSWARMTMLGTATALIVLAMAPATMRGTES